MAVGDLYRCAFQYTVYAEHCVNVMYFRQEGGAAVTAQDVAASLGPDISAVWGTFQDPNFVVHRTLSVQLVDRVRSDLGEASIVRNTSGPATGGLSPTLAVIVTLRTGLAGRRRRGRIYIAGSGVREQGGFVDNNGLANLTALGTSIINLWGPSHTTNYRLGVFSRVVYEEAGTQQADYWKPLTELTVQRTLGNQRRRRPGVGT